MTPIQLQVLKVAIATEVDPTFVAARDSGGTQAMADFLNEQAVPQHVIWNSAIPVNVIHDAVDWAQYTSEVTPDNTQTFANRALATQAKQMNLQTMLLGRETLDATKLRVREGLLDAVTGLPTGASGALRSAGGVGGVRVLNTCVRTASRAEKLFATANATTGAVSAFLPTFEGEVNADDVSAALAV